MAEVSLRRHIKEYLLCVCGALLIAVGVYFFKIPNRFSTGGVSGIAILISGFFEVTSPGTLIFVISMLLLIVGFIFCGRECGLKTIVVSMTISGSLLLLERFVRFGERSQISLFLSLYMRLYSPQWDHQYCSTCGQAAAGLI